jgi:hypothetical protein
MSAEGSFLTEELARRHDARRAAEMAHHFDEADTLVTPFVLAIARLAAQHYVANQPHGAGNDD